LVNLDSVAQICAKFHLCQCIGTTLSCNQGNFDHEISSGLKVIAKNLKNGLFYVVKLASFGPGFGSKPQLSAKTDSSMCYFDYWTLKIRSTKFDTFKQKKLLLFFSNHPHLPLRLELRG